MKEGNREKVEELQEKVDKFAEERDTWKKERQGWEEEKKRLGTLKVRCLDLETKLNGRIADLEADYDELKEKYEGVEVELEDLKGCIIQEHINGFQKGVRQAAFFCQDIDAADPRFDVNKDVVDDKLVNKVESSPEEEAGRDQRRRTGMREMPLRVMTTRRLRTFIVYNVCGTPFNNPYTILHCFLYDECFVYAMLFI